MRKSLKTANDMMKEGQSPKDVLAKMKEMDTESVTFTEIDQAYPEVDIRQWAMADFKSTEAHSGKELMNVLEQVVMKNNSNFEVTDRGSINGKNPYTYHVIANIVKKGTAASIETGFQDDSDGFNFGLCDMAGRLMTSMYRVTLGGYGDMRCLLKDGTSGIRISAC